MEIVISEMKTLISQQNRSLIYIESKWYILMLAAWIPRTYADINGFDSENNIINKNARSKNLPFGKSYKSTHFKRRVVQCNGVKKNYSIF